ncbi:hypothetical protein [Paracoccus sp. (in: a-proteobacteria)]|uniref:hypothetical protein n=1 Tax=Paracoccus sp. TaxID=267 RepID=UPI00333E2506
MAWHQHDGTMTLDTAEGYIEAPARFEVDADWSRNRNRWGYKTVEQVNACNLTAWNLGAATLPRETAVAILGESEVERQEDLAAEAWEQTAVSDEADGYADWRHDMAAE